MTTSITYLAVLASLSGQPFLARTGESGILGIPTSESLGLGGGAFGAELRVVHSPFAPTSFGPSPVMLGLGLGYGLELGVSLREGGQPGDPQPSPLLVGSALKLHLVDAEGFTPGFAVGVVGDRINSDLGLGARLIASTERVAGLMLAGFAGGATQRAGDASFEPTLGAGASFRVAQIQVDGEAAWSAREWQFGGAIRWAASDRFGLSMGMDWLPREATVRASVGLAFHAPAPPPPPKPPREVKQPKAPEPAPTPAQPAAPPQFTSDRPRFRFRIAHSRVPREDVPRHWQFGPRPPGGAAPADQAAAADPAPPATPGAEKAPEPQAPAALAAPVPARTSTSGGTARPAKERRRPAPHSAGQRAPEPPPPVEGGRACPPMPASIPVRGNDGLLRPKRISDAVAIHFTGRGDLSTDDRAALEDIAVEARRRGEDLLVWLRVGDSRGVQDAAERARVIQQHLEKAGRLPAERIYLEITCPEPVRGVRATVSLVTPDEPASGGSAGPE